MKLNDFREVKMWFWICEECNKINQTFINPKDNKENYIQCDSCKSNFPIEIDHTENYSDTLKSRIESFRRVAPDKEVFDKWVEDVRGQIFVMHESMDLMENESFIISPTDETGELLWAVDYEGFWLYSFPTREEAIKFADGMGIEYTVNEREKWLEEVKRYD